jgi:PAS domain S-box-containing protein
MWYELIRRGLLRWPRGLLPINRRVRLSEERAERFRAAFEQAAVGIAQLTADGRFLDVNPSFCRITGIPGEEIPKNNFWDNLSLDESVAELMDGNGRKTARTVETQYRRKDGSQVPLHLSMSLVRKESGEPAYFLLYVEDITQRKQNEQMLRESEQRLELALERSDLGLWDENVQTRQVSYSQRYVSMLGYSLDEIEPTEGAWRSLIHPEDRARVLSRFKDHVEGRASLYEAQYRLRAKSGDWRHILSSGKVCEWDESGTPVRVLGTHLDITDYKAIETRLQQAQRELEQRVEERTSELRTANDQLLQEIRGRQRIETALRESEERFRNLFEHSPLCVFEVDLSQPLPIILQVNRQAEPMLGWIPVELESAPLNSVLLSKTALEEVGTLGKPDGKEALYLEAIGQRRDGSRFPVRVSAAMGSMYGSSRAILILEDISVLILEDISAEKDRRTEEEAIAEERRRIAREIHDGLAQDLAFLRLKARLWKDLLERDPGRMGQELDSLRSILDKNIRDVRRSIFSLRPLALDELGFYPALRQFSNEFGEQNRLQIDLCVSGPEDCLPSNLELFLFRIIQEALNNVGKHADAVLVRIELKLDAADSMLFLRVKDDGKGFVPHAATTNYSTPGEHLGLRHMEERVESLGGTFLLLSRPGAGTEIQIIMPFHSPKGL